MTYINKSFLPKESIINISKNIWYEKIQHCAENGKDTGTSFKK